MPLFDFDVSVEVMGERQIAVDLEGALHCLLPSRHVHGRGRGIAELADQPVATPQPRPCRCELRIAIHRSSVEIERLRPFRGTELQLIGAQVQLVRLGIGRRVATDAVLLPARQRERERIDDLFCESVLQQEDLVILLGKIDDSDKVFLNGKLIGSSYEQWDKRRYYFVTKDQSKAGVTNTLIVYVEDPRGEGGIYEGPVGVLKQVDFSKYIRYR